MWQDQRLLAAIAALPAEAFIVVAPDRDFGSAGCREDQAPGATEPRAEGHRPPPTIERPLIS
ncbi:hypothetical protein [Paractinoplanes rishiriensis]|uniref:Uncharacterized protein n=1 Tax=Paractinoplanes rishiriensis TaxID=1050105 RepID=A0A919K6Y3_9ACTN|nr:hypothetical protein [Actinoplanes rishiriensis]GIF00488.1 hypothetical protein Ari01nite_79520 [Actinoplanes rishiriensis]